MRCCIGVRVKQQGILVVQVSAICQKRQAGLNKRFRHLILTQKCEKNAIKPRKCFFRALRGTILLRIWCAHQVSPDSVKYSAKCQVFAAFEHTKRKFFVKFFFLGNDPIWNRHVQLRWINQWCNKNIGIIR